MNHSESLTRIDYLFGNFLPLMKPLHALTAITIMLTAFAARAAVESNYYLADETIIQQLRAHSDGRNTYVDSVPGLVVLGATADGDTYVLPGSPQEIKIQLNGRKTSLLRGTRPSVDTRPSLAGTTNAAILAKINQLEVRLKRTQEGGQMSDGTPFITDDAQLPAEPSQEWVVLPGDVRLASTFDRWAKSAGWRVQWDANKHLLIDSTSSFTGSFVDAVKAALLTPGIRFGAYPLEACVYANTPPLIRITRQGEQSQECPD